MFSFVIFNIINVIIQTVKSIVTIKCNKWVAAIVNAIAYGLYTYIVVLTASDLDLWFKIFVTAAANLVGVFVVKWVEEKKRKDKLWKVEATIDWDIDENVKQDLTENGLVYNYIELGTRWTIFNIFCTTQEQSAKAKRILNNYHAKYFVSESKNL